MHLSEIQKQDADYYRVLEGEGKMNSNGLNEHWTASEARKKREIAIRKDERDKVLDEVLQLPQRREQPNGSMYIYVNDVKELRQKVGD